MDLESVVAQLRREMSTLRLQCVQATAERNQLREEVTRLREEVNRG